MTNLPAPPVIDWAMVAPTLVVALTGIIALMIEIVSPKRNNNMIVVVSLAGLVIGGLIIGIQFNRMDYPEGTTLYGMVLRDRFSLLMQLLVLLTTFLTVLFSEGYLREKRIPFGEFYPLLLWSAVGAMVMASTTNLLMIFLGLEVLSIALYVLAGMSRQETKSEESALKYFLLGAFASGFLLYGIALIYGATGDLNLISINASWLVGTKTSGVLILAGLGLMLIGFCFKASFVPFHQWTPDVYQGAPTNITAFMAAGSKIGAIAALWRVLEATSALNQFWIPAMFWVAILTMVVGNVLALIQKDVKRVLGYSSIAHAGYLLVAMISQSVNPTPAGLQAIGYYLLSYTLMTVGSFAVVTLAARGGKEGTAFDDVHGLWHRSPMAAGALIVFMASLIGIPPTAGFFGKLMVFQQALNAEQTVLAIVLAVTSIISVYYYLGIARAMFVVEEEGSAASRAKMHPGLAAACALCVIGIFGAAIFYSPLMALISPQ